MALRAGTGPAFLALGLGFLLRLWRVDGWSLWYDEAFSVYLAARPLTELIRHTAADIHPPGYYLLLHLWVQIAGQEALALSFFSAAFGLLGVAAVYRVTRHLLGSSAAGLAALLVALSPFQVWYGQEVRMYTLGALLVLTAGWCAWRFSGPERSPSRWAGAGYALAAAGSLYTLYYSAFALVFLALFATVRLALARNARGLGLWTGFQGLALLLYLPWLPVAVRQAVDPFVPPWRTFTPPVEIFGEAFTALAVGHAVEVAQTWPFLLLIGGIYLLGLAALWRRSPAIAIFAAGFTWAPVFLITLLSFVTPLFHARYVFTYSLPFYLVLAMGLVTVGRAAAAAGWLAGLVLAGVFISGVQAAYFDPRYQPDDYRGAVRFLAERWRPGDAVLINAGFVYPPVLYYLDMPVAWRGRLENYPAGSPPGGLVLLQAGSIGGDRRLGGGDPAADFWATDEVAVAGALERVARQHERLWVVRVYDTVTDPDGALRRLLAERALPMEDQVYGGRSSLRVQGFVFRAAAPLSGGSTLAGGVQVAGQIGADQVRTGETLPVQLRWQVSTEGQEDLRAYLALVDEKGRTWVQQDERPVGRLLPASRWPAGMGVSDPRLLAVPAGTPPGRYTVYLGAYRERSGQILDVLDAQGRSLGPRLGLGTVTVLAGAAPADASLVGRPLDLAAGPGVRLVGVTAGARDAQPGESLHVDLFWRSTAPLGERQTGLRLRDSSGALVAEAAGPAVDGRYPTGAWPPGAFVREQRELTLPAALADGSYRLLAWMEGGPELPLGSVRLRGRPRDFAPPVVQHPRRAAFGQVAELLGFDLRSASGRPLAPGSQVRPGETLHLTLYWRALGTAPVAYTVFTQLLDGAHQVRGQRDQPPGGGAFPTTSWIQDEILTDAYTIVLAPDTPSGRLRLVTGLYDPVSGARLPVSTGGDAVELISLDVP